MRFAALLAAALGAVCIQAQPAADEVTSLPGWAGDLPFRMYSGYVDVTDAHDGSRRLFYWFVEAAFTPATAPVVLWTNGGPGCSGMGGALTEMGPFVVGADGTLSRREFSWNKLANMLFIEQPAGVGFSVGNRSYWDDGLAAADNANFVARWRSAFPAYAAGPEKGDFNSSI